MGTTLARTWFDGGSRPDEVAYLAFTKAAAIAACTKIMESEEEMDPSLLVERFPLFRTIHSLAYMGLKRANPDCRVLTTVDMKEFSRRTSFSAAFAIQSWEDLAEVYQNLQGHGKTHWDLALAAYTLTRMSARMDGELDASRTRPCALANMMIGFVEEEVYRTFVEKYEAFKKSDGLIDFTDMLEFAARAMPPMDGVRYAIVDEAQDLCPLHWKILDRILRSTEQTWLIGDDDQALYRFSGASAELFLERARKADHQIVLRQTHRFGREIVDFSAKIIRRIKDRVEKDIIGVTGRAGSIIGTGEFKPTTGDTLVLHRHVAGCQAVARAYMLAGLPFHNERGRDPLGCKNRVKAWSALASLSDGAHVPFGAARMMVEELIPSLLLDDDGNKKARLVVHGGKRKMDSVIIPNINLVGLKTFGILTDEGASIVQRRAYEVLNHREDLEYYDRLTKNGHSTEERGAIITTAHGAKGRQALNVVAFTEMSRRCWSDPDTEHRLAYVAATRAQESLTICAERKVEFYTDAYNYPLEGN